MGFYTWHTKFLFSLLGECSGHGLMHLMEVWLQHQTSSKRNFPDVLIGVDVYVQLSNSSKII
jgi:hypothetical protein